MSLPGTEKISALVREFGLLDACLYSASRLLAMMNIGCLYRYTLVSQPVAPPADSAPRGSIEVREISVEDYQFNWFPRPEHVIRDRYEQGAICLVAFQKGEPIGFIWLIRDHYLEDEVRCLYVLSPSDKTAWDFDIYLDPKYRFGRGFGRLWNAADTLLHSEQRQWSLSRINAFNSSSLKAHQRRGAVITGEALFITIARVQLLLSNCSPFVHLSVGKSHVPKLVASISPEQKPEL